MGAQEAGTKGSVQAEEALPQPSEVGLAAAAVAASVVSSLTC